MRLYAKKDAAAFVNTGAKEFRFNREIQLTAGARDILTKAGVKLVFDEGAAACTAPEPTNAEAASDQNLWNSPEAQSLKEQICEMGRRMWIREYCDGNGGNLSCRLGPGRYVCTPTGVSKGFMKPEMLCLVDDDGRQLAGTWKRTSEFMSHAAIYKSTPEAFSVCHAHPCHAGAFAIKGMQPPSRLASEVELFVGTVSLAPYKTPGSAEIAAEIFQRAPKHQSIILGNHGVITWGDSVEDAYFKMEITDAYCRTVIYAQSIPGGTSIPQEGLDDLLKLKRSAGLPDDRYDLNPAQRREADPWRQMSGEHGDSSPATPSDPMTRFGLPSSELEALVQKITAEIISRLK